MRPDAWVDAFVESAVRGQLNMSASGTGGDPFNVWLLEPYFGDAWVEKWLEAIEKSESVEPAALSRTVVPSLWRKELRFLSYDAKIWGYGKADRLKIADFLRRMLTSTMKEDLFGFRSNKPHSREELDAIFSLPFVRADLESAREVGRLSASAPALSWSQHTDFYYGNYYEQYGAYDASKRFGRGMSLVVKKCGPFRCPQLWPESEAIKCGGVTTYAVYSGLSGHFDIINHFVSTENLSEKLRHFLVVADGKVLQLAEIRDLREYLALEAAGQFERVSDLAFEELKRRVTETKFYQFKDFFAALGMDWKPPRKVLSRMAGREFDPRLFPKGKSSAQMGAYWRRVIDPRKEFAPAEKRAWGNWLKTVQ